jgi:hypothetical protein
VLVSAAVKKELERFVTAKLWTGVGEKNGEENNAARLAYGTAALPLVVLLDPDGNEVGRLPEEGRSNFVITRTQMLEALRKIK